MNYRLIVIENSLKEKDILGKYKILSKTFFESGTSNESIMYKIEIPMSDVDKVAELLKNILLSPFYTHLYHEDPKNNSLIVIFQDQIFHTTKNNFSDALTYGITHGVSEEQMDIQPRNVSDERW